MASRISDKFNLDSFDIEDIDVSELTDIDNWLPSNGVVDVNIAEKGLIQTLHAQNICQEIMAKVDRWVSLKENEKNKAWSDAALVKATAAGHKTVKNREWFALSDDDYIKACNQLSLGKAVKKWLENKSQHFQNWHYAFKTFLKRDYGLERFGNFQPSGHDAAIDSGGRMTRYGVEDNISDEFKWDE